MRDDDYIYYFKTTIKNLITFDGRWISNRGTKFLQDVVVSKLELVFLIKKLQDHFQEPVLFTNWGKVLWENVIHDLDLR